MDKEKQRKLESRIFKGSLLAAAFLVAGLYVSGNLNVNNDDGQSNVKKTPVSVRHMPLG